MAVLDALDAYRVSALRKARFERLDGGRTFYAEIPSCKGVWAEGATKQEAIRELESALEAWIELRLEKGLSIPSLQ